MSLRFEWDDEKAVENLRKHKINFDEAKTIFGDPELLTVFDEKHSDEEDRFISVGTSSQSRVLLAVHTERTRNVIRIISCRKATRKERKAYEENSE